MDRLPSRDSIAGSILLIVGLFLLAGTFLPGVDRYIPAVVGLVVLGLFFVTRLVGALVLGGILTGIGIGILVATQGDPEFGGAGFLLSMGGGFLLVWLLGLLYQVPGTRFWPLIPGSVLIALGAVIFAGRMGRQVLDVASDWWPLVLVVVGLWLLVVARFRRRLADEDDEETRLATTADARDGRDPRARREAESGRAANDS